MRQNSFLNHQRQPHGNQPKGNKPKFTHAGGVFIALGALVGPLAGGYYYNQPIIGMLSGIFIGIIISGLIWLGDKRAQRR